MSFIEAGINRVDHEELRLALQERLDIVQHKIKFMDKVPVACLDTDGRQNIVLKGIIEDAGGILQEDPAEAQVVIFHELGTGLVEWMGLVSSLLVLEWPAVKYSRVYVMDDVGTQVATAAMAVSVLEDIAEMLYPGTFVFGNEGKTWAGFNV